jgi:hypothetical protein
VIPKIIKTELSEKTGESVSSWKIGVKTFDSTEKVIPKKSKINL